MVAPGSIETSQATPTAPRPTAIKYLPTYKYNVTTLKLTQVQIGPYKHKSLYVVPIIWGNFFNVNVPRSQATFASWSQILLCFIQCHRKL